MSTQSDRRQGTCKWFNSKRGYGFIAPADGSADLFVHQEAIINMEGFRKLREGQLVEYEEVHDETKGKMKAVEVSAGKMASSRRRTRKPRAAADTNKE